MTSEDPDAALYLKVADGDQAAFARLFDRHQHSVVRFAYRFVGDAARAEELAQEIFVKLFRSAKSYRPDAKFTTFLFRVATNHCLNERRKPSYRAESTMPELPDTQESPERPDTALEGQRIESAVHRALSAMSDRERAAFCMCRFEGLPYRDIAVALEATEAAVKSLIHRATVQVMQHVERLKAGAVPARSEA